MATETSGSGTLARRPTVVRVRPTVVSETRLRPSGARSRPGGQAPPRPSRPRPRIRVRVRPNVGSMQAPTGYQHVLMGEMLAAFVIIGIRAIADYAPAGDLHNPGIEKPPKGGTPVVLMAATLGVFFVLSFLATRGGNAAKASAAFGLLMVVGLMINSAQELGQVASWIENIGGNPTNQPSASSSGNSGGISPGNAPPGYSYFDNPPPGSPGHLNGLPTGPQYIPEQSGVMS